MSDAMPTPEEIKAREALGLETQPPPVHNDHPSSHDVAIALLGKRFAEAQEHMLGSKNWGLTKYHTILQPDNGRDSLQDLIEELGDALVYAITARAQREIDKERHRKALADAWADGHTKGWTDHAEPGYNTPTPNPYRTEAKEWTWDPDGDTQTVEEHLASPEFGAPCFSCGRRRHDKAVEKCYYC